jgi:hypothetical protein
MFWEETGGLLIEEFIAVEGNQKQGKRLMDGLIVLGESKLLHPGNKYDIKGKDVIVIQTKKGRLGMYLLGQAFFSKFLIQKLSPRSVRTVAICGKNDSVLGELAKQHGVEIVEYPDNVKK